MALKDLFTKKQKKTEERSIRAAFLVFFFSAVVALAAAFILSIEETHLLKNPDANLSCSFNLVLNCSTVMQTWQASVFFGIPNMFIGLMAFSVFVTVAVAVLWGGAQLKRWFLLALNVGTFAGAIFAYWLFFSSVYVIEVLCPWCLIVTFTSTLMLASTSYVTLRTNLKNFSKEANAKVQKFLNGGYYQLLVASWIVIMIALVFLKFGAALFA